MIRSLYFYPRWIPVLATAVVFFVLALAAHTVYASTSDAAEHIITVHDDGEKTGFYTDASTLREALEQAGIRVDESDRTEPGLDTPLKASSYEVNIYRARPVTIRDGASERKVLSAYRTPRQVAEKAGVMLQDEDIVKLSPSRDPVLDGVADVLTIDRALQFTFNFYGVTNTAYTQAQTVGGMLKEKDITLGEHDVIEPSVNAHIEPGMLVKLYRNGKQIITQEEDIEFEIEKTKDVNREPGFREVQTLGVKGKRTATYEIVMENGVEVSRKEVNSTIIKHPVKQVEVIGAKFNYTGGPLNEEQITALGMCESGMTATRNSGNGFYGAFQFMPSTWRTVAPAPYNTMMPHEAPLDAQKQAVQTLLSRSSIYTQFPGCARKMQASGVL